MRSLRPIIGALEEAHGYFNRELFAGDLSGDVVVTVQTKGRKRAYGWYGHGFWKATDGHVAPAEMNLSAEDLRREAEDVMLTLIHEMVHQWAAEQGVKDTSRGGRYHNREFARLAATAGLLPPRDPDKRHGFSGVTLGPRSLGYRARRAFDSLDSKIIDALTLARREFPPKASKSKMLLFVCGCEPLYKIRTGRSGLLAVCSYCGERFHQPNVEEESNG